MKNILFIVILLIAVSCTTTRYIEVPIDRVKTEYITQYHRDSIVIRDSIDKIIKGDSITITKYKYIYKQIIKNDTVLKTDTITQVVTVDRIEEVNVLKWWQEVLIYVGGLSITLLFILTYKKIKSIIK